MTPDTAPPTNPSDPPALAAPCIDPACGGWPSCPATRRYIGRYGTREEAERMSATYGDSLYPNRTVEPEEVGGRVDWLIWTVPNAT